MGAAGRGRAGRSGTSSVISSSSGGCASTARTVSARRAQRISTDSPCCSSTAVTIAASTCSRSIRRSEWLPCRAWSATDATPSPPPWAPCPTTPPAPCPAWPAPWPRWEPGGSTRARPGSPGVPALNSPWNSAWLASTATPIRAREKCVPASSVHTATASHQGTRIPSQAGIAPPPARWPPSATAVAIEAAVPPRTRRSGEREADMSPFCPVGPRGAARDAPRRCDRPGSARTTWRGTAPPSPAPRRAGAGHGRPSRAGCWSRARARGCRRR